MDIKPGTSYALSLFTAQTGALSARLDRDDGTFLHIHSLVDPEAEAALFADQILWGDRIILAGCGLGYHLAQCINSIRPDAQILVIDVYQEFTAKTSEFLSRLIDNSIITIDSTTKDSASSIKQFVAGGKMLQVIRHPAAYRANEEFFCTLLADVQPSLRNKKTDSLLFMQGGFFAEAELGRAAEQHGVRWASFDYKNAGVGIQYENTIQKALQKERPSAIISVNMLGIDSDHLLTDYAVQYGIPVVTWFVDDPRPMLLTRKSLISEGFIAVSWERAYLPFLESCGFSKVAYLPLAGDPSVMKQDVVTTPSVNVGFVGSSMGEAFLAEIARKFLWKHEYGELARHLAPKIISGAFESLDQLIGDYLSGKLPDAHTVTWLRSYCLHYASMLKRKKSISALFAEEIELFGDPDGWKRLCGDAVTVHRDHDYQTEVPGVYRRTFININSTSCQMPTAVNQRVFDVPLCGGFLLTDDQAEMHQLFSDNEMVLYQSEDDLLDKTRYYLRHPEERSGIVSQAHERIIHEHTYKHRLKTLLSLL